MKTSLILAKEAHCVSQTSATFCSRNYIEKLRKSSRFLIEGLFSALCRSPSTTVLRDVAKESKQPLIGMHKLNGGYLHIAVYTKYCRSFNQTWHCSSEIAQAKLLVTMHLGTRQPSNVIALATLSPHNWR